MKFLGRDPPESSLPASDRAPSEVEGETGGAGRTFSIFPANPKKQKLNKNIHTMGYLNIFLVLFFLKIVTFTSFGAKAIVLRYT